ncbi:hypothetical protein C1J00_34915 [Streptomyces cahuitamycinicus]|uniref:Uncharacterized protein n=1 Tax=Streptomyces cahuitamycinicus TaxID=2070367 RepID=A0A2N8TFH4_9ACTN|nr:hypothetical protein C1J00_34915 [Streptomyces cahuitamycinicus]
MMLTPENSLSFRDPFMRDDRKGDIRFDCKDAGCAVESDTSVFLQLFGKSGATLDECRLMLASADRHRWPLASTAAGTEICVKHQNGDIALLVLQTKSTAVPDIAFLQLDMTIWRDAA